MTKITKPDPAWLRQENQEADDAQRVEDIRRWLLFNTNPTDEHWKNIETLIHKLTKFEETHKQELKDERTGYEQSISDIEHEHDVEVKNLKDELERYELDLNQANRHQAYERARADWFETIIRKQAATLEKLGRPNQIKLFEDNLKKFQEHYAGKF